MIAIFNRLSVEEGAAGQVVERFASSGGYVQGFPGFVSMEVLSSKRADKALVIARWQSNDVSPSSACCSRRRFGVGAGYEEAGVPPLPEPLSAYRLVAGAPGLLPLATVATGAVAWYQGPLFSCFCRGACRERPQRRRKRPPRGRPAPAPLAQRVR